MCCSGVSSAPGLQHSLAGLVSSAHTNLYLLVVGVEPVQVFSVWLAKISLSCVVHDLLQIPSLVLSFPSPPIGREHCPSPAQNSPYG